MKNMKRLIAVIATVGVLGTAGAAFAATAKTPAEIAASLTGKTVEDLYQVRTAGKTYGTIANEAGKLEEFKVQMLEQKKVVLDQRVKDGTLAQERANEIYNTMKSNQETCDGTGTARLGKSNGIGFGAGARGLGNGQGKGAGKGMGGGFGGGMGAGRGLNR